MPPARPEPTTRPVALFVFSNLREQKGGLTRAWLRRLQLFHDAGWETHVATIHLQPEIDETLAAWRERGWLPVETTVHHYQRRSRRFRASWSRPTDEHFTRDNRVADWLDWLVGLLPGVVVFADSPVTYAPVAMMRNPYVGRIMTVHLAHRKTSSAGRRTRKGASRQRSRYQGPPGQPKLTGRFLPFASQADAVVALTHRQAQHLAEDVPGLSVQVIPNIVDPPPPLESSRDRMRVVSIGRLDPLKRIDDAMQAVALARRSVPGLRLEVWGRGPDLERLLALRTLLGIEDAVTFCGFTETPYAVLAGARASLMTSRREGFGLAVAESLAVGTPVITYDVDYGPAELVVDAVNGRVVADGDVEQLAAALVQTVTQDELWGAMSAAGPPAVAHLAQQRVASAWLDLAATVAAAVPQPEPGVLVEDLRVRRGGLEVLGVAYSVGGRGPQALAVRSGAASGGLSDPSRGAEPPAGLVASRPGPGGPDVRAPADRPALGAVTGLRRSEAFTFTVELPELTATARACQDGDVGGCLLTAVDAEGAELPALGPGVPATVVPTQVGPLVVAPSLDGSLKVSAPDRVIGLHVSRERVDAEIQGDVTPLADSQVLEAGLLPSRAPHQLWVRCWTPGLDVVGDAELSLVLRTEPPRVVGSVRLRAGRPVSAPGDRWQALGTISWDQAALADAAVAVPTRIDLGVTMGRQVRSVARIAGPGRPVPIRVAGTHWVMATSSNGRLMLLRGRGLRARVGWTLRRVRSLAG